MRRRQCGVADEIDPARSRREAFYPKGRNGGVVVRIRVGDSRAGGLLSYSPARVGTHRRGADGGRTLDCVTAHGQHPRPDDGKIESVEFESSASIEKRCEAEVREYLERRTG